MDIISAYRVGYIPFDHDAVSLFFQLVAARYEEGSIIVTVIAGRRAVCRLR
jgi:hypothetical protein